MNKVKDRLSYCEKLIGMKTEFLNEYLIHSKELIATRLRLDKDLVWDDFNQYISEDEEEKRHFLLKDGRVSRVRFEENLYNSDDVWNILDNYYGEGKIKILLNYADGYKYITASKDYEKNYFFVIELLNNNSNLVNFHLRRNPIFEKTTLTIENDELLRVIYDDKVSLKQLEDHIELAFKSQMLQLEILNESNLSTQSRFLKNGNYLRL